MRQPADTRVPYRQGLEETIRRLEMRTGFLLNNREIPDDMTFVQWCEKLADEGLKVDGYRFTLDERPSLMPIYRAIPTTREEARGRILVIMKGAQMGLTVWEMLANIYMAIKFEPCVIGMYLPDQATAGDKSSRRFMRIVRTIPKVYHRLTHRVESDGSLTKVGDGNVMTRVMGESSFLFLWTSGAVSTESRPMDVLSLDECQEMTLEQIDKTRERLSASTIRLQLMLSTANIPDLDIHFWFKEGNQQTFHTQCPACEAMSDLSDHFPDCVKYNTGQIAGAPMNEYVYVCPECGGYIEDTQRGDFVAMNPDSRIESWHISQIISPTISPRELIESWNRAVTGDQRKTFYNRKLGKPYIDKDQIPVAMEDCLACVEEGKRAGVTWLKKARDTFMGLDQMGGFICVIIKQRMSDGRQATIHVEAIFDDDPFERCSELMGIYGVSVCVVETLPNVNDARRFANRHRGRVYLAGYANLRDDFIVWSDQMTRSDRKTAEEDRNRYTVTLHQYRCMQASMARIVNRNCLFPDPGDLEQDVIEQEGAGKGKRKRIQILRDWVFMHFTKTGLVVEQDEEVRKASAKVVKIGIDPHFSYANMLCDVAWARSHGTSQFILPQEDPVSEKQKNIEESMPGLPTEVIAMVDDLPAGVCGRCSAYDAEDGSCMERGFFVGAKDPGCMLFTPMEDD